MSAPSSTEIIDWNLIPSEIAMAQIKGKRTAMRQRIRMRLRSLFRMMFPMAAKRKLRCLFILFFQKKLIDRYLLKIGDRCRSIWTVGIPTRNGPEGGIIHGLNPRVKIDEVPDGSADGPHSTPIWNFINFDPRIQPVDDSTLWPIPGGYSYGPDRTATVSYFEEIPVNQLLIFPSPPPSPLRGEEKGEGK